MSTQDTLEDLRDCWFRVALAVNGELSPTKIFPPLADVRLGTAPHNEFVVSGVPWASLLVLSSGTTLHLLPESEVRMGGRSSPLTVARYDGSSRVAVTAESVKYCVTDSITMFVHYHPNREALEDIVRWMDRRQHIEMLCAPRVLQSLPAETSEDRTRARFATTLAADVLTVAARLGSGADCGAELETQRELLAESLLVDSTDESVARLPSDHARLAEMVEAGADASSVRRQCQDMLAGFGIDLEDVLTLQHTTDG